MHNTIIALASIIFYCIGIFITLIVIKIGEEKALNPTDYTFISFVCIMWPIAGLFFFVYLLIQAFAIIATYANKLADKVIDYFKEDNTDDSKKDGII